MKKYVLFQMKMRLMYKWYRLTKQLQAEYTRRYPTMKEFSTSNESNPTTTKQPGCTKGLYKKGPLKNRRPAPQPPPRLQRHQTETSPPNLGVPTKLSRSLGDLSISRTEDRPESFDVSVVLKNLGISEKGYKEDQEYVNYFLTALLDEDQTRPSMESLSDFPQSLHDKPKQNFPPPKQTAPTFLRSQKRGIIRRIKKSEIGHPIDFVHRQHVGYEKSVGFVMEGLDDGTKDAFEKHLLYDQRHVTKKLDDCFDFLESYPKSDDEVDSVKHENRFRRRFASRLHQLRMTSNCTPGIPSPDIELQDPTFMDSLLDDGTDAFVDPCSSVKTRSMTNSPISMTKLFPPSPPTKSASMSDIPSALFNSSSSETKAKGDSRSQKPRLTLFDPSERPPKANSPTKLTSPGRPTPLRTAPPPPIRHVGSSRAASEPKDHNIATERHQGSSPVERTNIDATNDRVPISESVADNDTYSEPIPIIRIGDSEIADSSSNKCPTPNNTPASSFADSYCTVDNASTGGKYRPTPLPRKRNMNSTPSTTELLSEVCKVVNGPEYLDPEF